MAESKTKPNDASVDAFLQGVADAKQRDDAVRVLEIMRAATGEPPKMWGGSIVGFGSQHYEYESGRSGDWFLVGFSPRKANLTLYFGSGIEQYSALLEKLGKHKIGKGCLYLKRLEDVDVKTLRKLVETSVAQAKAGRKAKGTD